MTDTRDPQTEKGQNGATEENLAETAQAPEKTLEEQFRDLPHLHGQGRSGRDPAARPRGDGKFQETHPA